MRNAIVAIEDSRFYQHGAIDIRGTVRALVNDLQHKSVQGGSTLTQQYVKNALILTAPNTQQAQQATSRHAQPEDQGTADGHRRREEDDQEPDPGRAT